MIVSFSHKARPRFNRGKSPVGAQPFYLSGSACNGRARRRSHRQYRKRCRSECSAVCKLSFQQGEMPPQRLSELSMWIAGRCRCSFRMKNRGRCGRHISRLEETDLAQAPAAARVRPVEPLRWSLPVRWRALAPPVAMRGGEAVSGTILFRGAARCETSKSTPHKDATTTRNSPTGLSPRSRRESRRGADHGTECLR